MTHSYANCIVVGFGEATLKQRNFKSFRDRLVENTRSRLEPEGFAWPVTAIHNRLLVRIPEECSGSRRAEEIDRCLRVLSEVPGVAVVAPRRQLSREEVVDSENAIRYEVLEPWVVEIARETWEADRDFVVEAKRADRDILTVSQRIESRLGRAILEQTAWDTVNVHNASRVFHVDLYKRAVYVGADTVPAIGGLPTGASGHLLALISGGIDSPAAAWLMARRGCRLDLLHFAVERLPVPGGADTPGGVDQGGGGDEPGGGAEESAAQAGVAVSPAGETLHEVASHKVVRLALRLSEFAGTVRLHVVPEARFDVAMLDTDTPYRLLIFRRFMTRCGEVLARRRGASALVVGDSLGQVASQTIENIVSATQALEMPILRPLLGFDKQEIVAMARRIGTYDISIEKYKDCCAMMARTARTRSRNEVLSRIEAEALPEYDRVVEASLGEATVVECRYGKVSGVWPADASE